MNNMRDAELDDPISAPSHFKAWTHLHQVSRRLFCVCGRRQLAIFRRQLACL